MPCLPTSDLFRALGLVCVGRVTEHRVGRRRFWIEWTAAAGPAACKPGGDPYRRVPRWVRAAMGRIMRRRAKEARTR